VITALRDDERLARALAQTRLHALREIRDLHAGVVVVELTRDGPALRAEQRGNRVTKRGLTPMAHMKRARRVRRDELDVRGLSLSAVAVAP
jgi:hypothetical protein